jgi:Holliday junction resolvase RusA-like endonuclease
MALQARQKAGISRPFEGPCSVHIDLHLKTRGLTDIDNAAKALMDSINKVIYQDDRQVVELGVHIHVGSKEPRAVVAIAELEAA